MKNVLLFTTDENVLDVFKKHVLDTYGYVPEVFTDIDWTGISPKTNVTAFSLQDTDDVLPYLRENGIGCFYLFGNSYARRTQTVPSASDYTEMIGHILNSKALEYGYDNIISVCSYATSTVDKYRIEGQAFVAWRDGVWSTFYAAVNTAQETGNWPTPEAMAELLPTLDLPPPQ